MDESEGVSTETWQVGLAFSAFKGLISQDSQYASPPFRALMCVILPLDLDGNPLLG